MYAQVQILVVNYIYIYIYIYIYKLKGSHFYTNWPLQCIVVLPRQLTTLSLEAFSICIDMASSKVHCLLLLMHLLHIL